jgi:iron complex outermembrane receptor protein
MRNILICTLFVFASYAYAAEDKKIGLQEIPVTANPLQVYSNDIVKPVGIVGSKELIKNNSASLGKNLENIPGVSNSAWGENVGRPVIRGMDGNRIKILNNGLEVNDVSAMSGDHPVGIDALSAEQIEIIKGPASIIYGGGSVGGTINIIDHTIHDEFNKGLTGVYDFSHGGALRESTNSFKADYGFKNFMLHLDGFKRDSKNLKIPGNSVSSKLSAARAAEGEPIARNANGKNTLNSSYNDSYGSGVGASYIFSDGYTGFSYKGYDMEYGNPIENGAHIDAESDRYNYILQKDNLSSNISSFKFDTSYTEYEQDEVEPSGEIATQFLRNTYEGKFELTHSFINETRGVIGLDFGTSRFSKEKGGPMIANNNSEKISLYLLENFTYNNQNITFGFRQGFVKHHGNDFVSDDGCTVDYLEAGCEAAGGEENTTSFDDTEKTFQTSNISIETKMELSPSLSLGVSLSHIQRAPTYEELFAYGHHHATETIEQGDRGLSEERSNSLDMTLNWKGENKNIIVSPYYTRFNSYIAMINTGQTQKHMHEGEEESEEISVFEYKNIPAEFYGVEVQGDFDLSKNYKLSLWGDYVRAKNRDGGNLPRIPPATLGATIFGDWGNFKSDLSMRQVFSQNKIGKHEIKTDDYSDVTFNLSYQIPSHKSVSIYIKAENLLDEDIRDHASFIKDQILGGGRNIKGGFNVSF